MRSSLTRRVSDKSRRARYNDDVKVAWPGTPQFRNRIGAVAEVIVNTNGVADTDVLSLVLHPNVGVELAAR